MRPRLSRLVRRSKPELEDAQTPHEGLPPSFRPSIAIPSASISQDASKPFSSRSRNMAPVRITCRDWNDGEIFDWYEKESHTTISRLELRKERDRFKHEYIVIYLDNGWIHRIERRPTTSNMETISKQGCEAYDGLTPISDEALEIIRSETDVVITLKFPSNGPDLYNVIAVAVAIHLDPQARNYTLQQYNCYFVARSIIALVTRHCIFHAPLLTGLRWDGLLTESAIFHYIFGGDWNKVATVMKASISAVLDDMLLNIINGTSIENNKDWDRLHDIVRRVIDDEVERSSTTLAIHNVRRAVYKWIMDATQATLWHENLNKSLSDRRHTKQYETTAEDAMKVALRPELVIHLPGNMLKELSTIRPPRFVSRVPSAALIIMTPERLAGIPIGLLEKMPDDFIAKLPYDAFRNAPAELWQKLSVQVFSRARDAVLLTLPDDLNLVPQRLLDVSLHRMQVILNQSKNHPDRVFALRLLRRLPLEQLTRLDLSVAISGLEADEDPNTSVDYEMGMEQIADRDMESVREKPRGRRRKREDEFSVVGLLIRLTPKLILGILPACIIDIFPDSSLGLIPISALERLPKKFLAKITVDRIERLPDKLLHKVSVLLLQRLPRSTLEKLSRPFLEGLPTELLQRVQQVLLANIPEDISDQIRAAMESSAFEGEGMKQKLVQITKEILGQPLVESSGELPATVIRVSVRADSSMQADEELLKHEDLQKHLLNMIRAHGKKVAQVPLLGMSEETVYEGLHTKMEEIWQVMRLHPSFPGRS